MSLIFLLFSLYFFLSCRPLIFLSLEFGVTSYIYIFVLAEIYFAIWNRVVSHLCFLPATWLWLAFCPHGFGRRQELDRVFGAQSFCVVSGGLQGEGCWEHNHSSPCSLSQEFLLLPSVGSWLIHHSDAQGISTPARSEGSGRRARPRAGLGGPCADRSVNQSQGSLTGVLTVVLQYTRVFGPRCRQPVLALSKVTWPSSGLPLLCLQ